ncbi:MAG TPA: hypothetical protein ENO23_07515, partial [Alphaproteobacteria bacterium]|nr:hypothetical protein [Alphaproteobacteria bacterium]
MNRGFRNDSSPDDQGNNEPRSPLGRWSVLVWLLLLMIALPFVWQLLGGSQTAPQIEYSTFRRMVQEGNVERITVSGEEITGELNEAASTTLPTGESVNYTEFVTYVPSFGDEELMPLLREYDVEINTQPENTFNWWIILLNGLPFLL